MFIKDWQFYLSNYKDMYYYKALDILCWAAYIIPYGHFCGSALYSKC